MRKILTIFLFLCLAVPAFGQFFTPHQKPMLGLRINRAHQLGDPVAHYLMNEGSGNKVFDLSGNGNDGTFQGTAPSWSAGKFGSAILLPGTNEYISSTVQELYQKDKTVHAWIKMATVGQVNNIFGIADTPSDGTPQNLVTINANNRLASYGTKDGGGFDYLEADHTLVVDTWYCITFVDNTSDGVGYHLYLNGVETAYVAGTTGVYTDRDNTLNNLFFGVGYNNDYFNGQIDHIMIYNRVLSASEIALLYREPFCMFKRDNIWVWGAGVAAPDWIPITSAHYDSHCGDTAGWTIEEALDGTDYWYHGQNHTHWVILDLTQTFNVQKVRGRSETNNDPTVVNIYVSNDTGSWGTAVATNIATWQDTSAWVEIDTKDKNGRYVKVEITSTEDVDDYLTFGNTGSPFSIFDAYVATPTASRGGQIIFINFF